MYRKKNLNTFFQASAACLGSTKTKKSQDSQMLPQTIPLKLLQQKRCKGSLTILCIVHKRVKTIIYGCDCSSETHSQQSENYIDKFTYSWRAELFWPLLDNEKLIYTKEPKALNLCGVMC